MLTLAAAANAGAGEVHVTIRGTAAAGINQADADAIFADWAERRGYSPLCWSSALPC